MESMTRDVDGYLLVPGFGHIESKSRREDRSSGQRKAYHGIRPMETPDPKPLKTVFSTSEFREDIVKWRKEQEIRQG